MLRPCRTAKLRNCWQTANCQTAPKTPASRAGLGTAAAETSSTEPSLIIAARSGARVKSGLGCHIRCAKRGSPWNGPSAESQAGALLSPENKTKGKKTAINCNNAKKTSKEAGGWLQFVSRLQRSRCTNRHDWVFKRPRELHTHMHTHTHRMLLQQLIDDQQSSARSTSSISEPTARIPVNKLPGLP